MKTMFQLIINDLKESYSNNLMVWNIFILLGILTILSIIFPAVGLVASKIINIFTAIVIVVASGGIVFISILYIKNLIERSKGK